MGFLIENGVLKKYTMEKGIDEIVIPDEVTAIAPKVFNKRGLVSVTVPKSVTEIPEDAFRDCEKLKSVFLHDGIKRIGANAFLGCISLENMICNDTQSSGINLPKSLSVIESATFCHCYMIKSVELPESITKIGYKAFGYCKKLKELKFPASVKLIEQKAFFASDVKRITLEQRIETIGKDAFSIDKDAFFLFGGYRMTSYCLLQKIKYKGIMIDLAKYCTSDYFLSFASYDQGKKRQRFILKPSTFDNNIQGVFEMIDNDDPSVKLKSSNLKNAVLICWYMKTHSQKLEQYIKKNIVSIMQNAAKCSSIVVVDTLIELGMIEPAKIDTIIKKIDALRNSDIVYVDNEIPKRLRDYKEELLTNKED